MIGSFQALLTGAIDYAGLFPPAELDLPTAIGNYTRYQDDPEAWMLGRFIIPAEILADLAPFRTSIFDLAETPVRFSVLVGGGATAEEGRDRLERQTAQILAFQKFHGVAVSVDTLETRLPDDLAANPSPKTTLAYLKSLARIAGTACVDRPELFVEIPDLNVKPASLVPVLAGMTEFALAMGTNFEQTRPSAFGPVQRVGLKLRCGGGEAAASPSTRLVANALLECRKCRLPIKCTAGLHHPLRKSTDTIGTMSHGFLNVLTAGALVCGFTLDPDRLEACLEDEAAENFRFADDMLAWQEHEIPTAEVARARYAVLTGFGSCSFSEPRMDLHRLGLLTGPSV
jgi:hypothetical protein